MSKKRTSACRRNDEQIPGGSDCELTQAESQHEDEMKRAKLISFGDTTLQDLPIELFEHILVEAIVGEVKDMKLAKSVWKDKADLVIRRHSTVSLQWNCILTSSFFQSELRRTLDATAARETMHWKIFLQPLKQSFILGLTTLRDEIFMILHRHGGYVLDVYDRNSMIIQKDVLRLSEFYTGQGDLAACNLSNCIYVLNAGRRQVSSVARITKDEHQFGISVWIKNLRLPVCDVGTISVAANGNVIILSRQRSSMPVVVGIYDASGIVQHKIRLSPGIVSCVIQRADGNLVLNSNYNVHETKLLEIDTSGRMIREYQSSGNKDGVESFEDVYGRILVIFREGRRIELLDSEFNFLDSAVPRLDDGKRLFPQQLHYNRERHEMIGVCYDRDAGTSALVTFRFTEE